jgi:hypothetical protein
MKDFEVYSVQKPPKSQKREAQVIGFSEDDYAGVSLPRNALVLSLAIANHKIHRILIDSRSLADILYRLAFELMKIDRRKVVPARHSLVGFTREQVIPLGSIAPSHSRSIPEAKDYNGPVPNNRSTFDLQRHPRKNGS